uniref:C2H2-type domain-containing protein n=1 Tax=Strongyloides papillosus TaxID=174720 RepID=A0A0N5BQ11_STREA
MECFFNIERLSPFENNSRQLSASKVSINCQRNKNIKLYRFEEIGTIAKVKDLFGAKNIVDLMMQRGAGNYDINWEVGIPENLKNLYVCELHVKELLTDYEKQIYNHIKKRTYGTIQREHVYDCTVSTIKFDAHEFKYGKRVTHRMDSKLCRKVLMKHNILFHPGHYICDKHWEAFNAIEEPEPDVSLLSSDVTFKIDTTLDTTLESTLSEKIGKIVRNLSSLLNLKGSLDSGKFIDDAMSSRNYNRKKYNLRCIIEAIAGVMVPNSEELIVDSFKDYLKEKNYRIQEEKTPDIIENIIEVYNNAESKVQKLGALELLSTCMPYNQVVQYFNGLSRYVYTQSKYLAAGITDMKKRKRLERYDKEAVKDFVSFISTPLITTIIPWQEMKIVGMNNVKEKITMAVRDISNTAIIKMYMEYCNERRKELTLSESVMMKVLLSCTAIRNKSKICVDYFYGDLMDSLKLFYAYLDEMSARNILTNEKKRNWTTKIELAITYLKTDYKINVKKVSNVADHCYTHALTQVSSPSLCEHLHNIKCTRCDGTKLTFNEIRDFLESHSDSELSQNACEQLKIVENNLFLYKGHILRGVACENIRKTIVKNLRTDEALLTLDFSQKVIPQTYREKQTDYYGKKGISVHIVHVLKRESDEDFSQLFFADVFDGTEKQDFFAVAASILNVLTVLKQKSNIKKINLRSDNAACYKNACFYHLLNAIEEKTGIKINSYSYSEIQLGKGPCDRIASVLSRRKKEFINNKNDILTPKDLVKAYNSVENPSYVITLLKFKSVSPFRCSKIKNIRSITYISFKDTEFEVWEHYNVGVPSKITYENSRTIKKYIPDIICNFTSDEECTFTSLKNDMDNNIVHLSNYGEEISYIEEFAENPEEEEDKDSSPLDEKKIKPFFCPVEGCTSAFLRIGNLHQHSLLGVHKYKKEKLTLREYAVDNYKKQLEYNISEANFVKEEILKSFEEENKADSICLPVGWALKKNKPRDPIKLEVKEKLINMYLEGKKGSKISPAIAIERLTVWIKEEKKIKIRDIPSLLKIGLYFSWLKALENKGKNIKDILKKDDEEFDEEKQNDYTVYSLSKFINESVFDNEIEDIIDSVSKEEEAFKDEPEILKRGTRRRRL